MTVLFTESLPYTVRNRFLLIGFTLYMLGIMLTSTEKVRRFRARKRLGKAVLSAEVELGLLADMLVSHGFLQQWDDGDRAKIQAAFQEWVAVSYRYE